MQPVATTFFFYFLSGLALLGGVLVITRRNPVHSALSLILTLLALAGLLYFLMRTEKKKKSQTGWREVHHAG